jgi:hypothetical protein
MKSINWIFPIIFLLLSFAGCGHSTSLVSSSTSTQTPLPTFTATPFPTPNFDIVTKTCSPEFIGIRKANDFIQIGDLVFPRVAGIGGISYPNFKLPDDLSPNQPYTFQFPASYPVINPRAGFPNAGYAFDVCNLSLTRPHIIQSATMIVRSYAPITKTNFNVMPACDDGCGGNSPPDDWFQGKWPPTIETGTSIEMQLIPGSHANIQPFTIKPANVYTVWIEPDKPGLDGVYDFTVSLQFDATPNPITVILPQTIYLTDTSQFHSWSPRACDSSIPTASPGYETICPKK